MIKTYGLTHIALAVKDAKRSFDFFRKVLAVVKVYDQGGFIQAPRGQASSLRLISFLWEKS